uniref:Capsid protein n=1 Tax=Cucumber fruit mottle mosaic virus TaxID=146499 RepID=G9FYN9_9VIRU|nr:coat protein [Cucumber fruit mottle mosaic virus]
MSYSTSGLRSLPAYTKSFCPYYALYDLLVSAQGGALQTQNGKDILRDSINGLLTTVASPTSRFPAEGFFVWSRESRIAAILDSLLSALDSRNRAIEVENPSNPSTSEALNATKRNDDASTAAHNDIPQLISALNDGAGVFDRASFESQFGLVWTAASSSTSK